MAAKPQMVQYSETFPRQVSDNTFPLRFVGIVHCPADGGELFVGSNDSPAGEAIGRGLLICKSCKRSFPIVNGILRLLDVEQLDEEALHEVTYRDESGRHSQEQIQ